MWIFILKSLRTYPRSLISISFDSVCHPHPMQKLWPHQTQLHKGIWSSKVWPDKQMCEKEQAYGGILNKNAKLMLWQWVYMIDVLVWQRKNQGEKRWHERWHRIISQTRIADALTFKIKQLADSLVQITLPTILDKPFDISQSQRTRSHAHASSSPYFRLKASSTKAYYVLPIIDTVHKIF